jgi:hypothetical protein
MSLSCVSRSRVGLGSLVCVGRLSMMLGLMSVLSLSSVRAQSTEDAIFMDRRILCAGLFYSRDAWDQYWEGSLKRANGNVGTLTTQQTMVMAVYGVTNRLNISVSLPYVSTRASQGVLEGQRGRQDLTVALKYNALTTPLTSAGTLRAIGVVALSAPSSDYTPDFLPMSIGLASRRAMVRGLLQFESHAGVYVNTSASYTRRGNVTLDRPAYYTNGQLFLTNEVQMPDVSDMALTLGYQRRGLVMPVTITQQRTRGGGDIRRQDAPFVSNRMNFTRVDGRVQVSVPKFRAATLHLGASRVLSGRNVGQSTTFMGGVVVAGRL